MEEQPSIFTDEQIAKFLESITDPEDRARQEAWFRKFGRTAAQMNEALPVNTFQNGMEQEGSSEENG